MNIIYLHGFGSSPGSSKARFFRQRFEELGMAIEIPDLAGGDFEHLSITGQLDVIERTASGRSVTLIGSSMGGYLAALYAARHTEVERLVLMAPAFCFARRWPEILGEPATRDWEESGWRTVFHYGEGQERKLSYHLITDGLLYEDYPDARQPTLILHGEMDDVVPPGLSQEFVRSHPNARLVLLPSDHELTDVTVRLWDETVKFLRLTGESG